MNTPYFIKHATLGSFFMLSAASAYASSSYTLTLSSPTESSGPNSIVLVWKAPSDISSISDYQILENGSVLTTASANNKDNSSSYPFIEKFYKNNSGSFTQKIVWENAKINKLSPDTTYQFKVRSISSTGHVLNTSNTLSVKTTSKPTVINITNYGAKGNDKKDNTDAIQDAIDACSSNCEVQIPSGTFITGAIFLKSNMTLDVEKGAILKGSTLSSDYPLIDKKPTSLINLRKSSKTTDSKYSDVRIIGQGIIDGNGWKTSSSTYKNYLGDTQANYLHGSNTLYSSYGILAKAQVEAGIKDGLSAKKAYSTRRSSLITLKDASNVYLEGVTLRNPADHGIVSLSCTNMTLNGVKVETYNANNGDGIDINRNTNAQVFNSYFDTGDDAVNFAAGKGAAAASEKGVNGAWIFNNFIAHGHGGIVLGSMTGSWIKNVTAENNVMVGTNIGLRAKSNDKIGGGATGIIFRNTAMQNLVDNAVVLTLQYGDPNASTSYKAASTPAQFSDFKISHVSVDTITGKEPSVQTLGDSSHKAYNKEIDFKDVRFKDIMPTDIEDLHDSTFNKVTYKDLKKGKAFWSFSHVKNVTVDGLDSSNVSD